MRLVSESRCCSRTTSEQHTVLEKICVGLFLNNYWSGSLPGVGTPAVLAFRLPEAAVRSRWMSSARYAGEYDRVFDLPLLWIQGGFELAAVAQSFPGSGDLMLACRSPSALRNKTGNFPWEQGEHAQTASLDEPRLSGPTTSATKSCISYDVFPPRAGIASSLPAAGTRPSHGGGDSNSIKSVLNPDNLRSTHCFSYSSSQEFFSIKVMVVMVMIVGSRNKTGLQQGRRPGTRRPKNDSCRHSRRKPIN